MSISFKNNKSIDFYLSYHQALIRYHELCIKALKLHISPEIIYSYSLPVNITNSKLIDSYSKMLEIRIKINS